MAAPPDPSTPGLRAPDFVLPTTDGTPTRFYGAVGGDPLVLCFGDAEIAVHNPADPAADPILVFVDAEGEVRDRFGAAPHTAVVLDPNLRVLGTASAPDGRADHTAVAAHLERLPRHDDVQVSAQAPVLLIPDVLSPEWCERLMAMWADSGAEETGVETTVEETRAEVRNAKAKRRRDLVVTDAQANAEIAQAVGQVVMPEIRRAFNYRATRFEGFKIGCYDEESAGFFSRHRDNLSPSTAHRRFALSLNLNDGYEGGEVRFGEFGPMRYRPPAGGALVFSGALLHEVLPVTGGRRFVLLSFLWGDDVRRPPTAS
ncbi:2OG-Fe(II) oxygenase family protein [Euzebya sp.]|uniref:2OG-Fe(II) oxygenase family protein n=1 Tax=Euzebya sp. TaxID=1971409 RepID=UPI00351745C1